MSAPPTINFAHDQFPNSSSSTPNGQIPLAAKKKRLVRAVFLLFFLHLSEYRSRGIGTYLVTLLKNKIEEMGDIPFYGTSVSNYHSWNIALNAGFKPAWVEIGAKKQK